MTAQTHLRCSLLLIASFLAMGLALEGMLGFRTSGWVDDPLLREFLRLGHGHGGLLALLSLVAAWAMQTLQTPAVWARPIRLALVLASPLVGLGFIGGGLWHGPIDPGPIVLVVPAGALLALASLLAIAWVRSPDQPKPGNES